MELKITPAVRRFYKQLASVGGKARAKKYDHATLSEWAKLGGRPRKKVLAAQQSATPVRRAVVLTSGHGQ
jgi:hypothetical protein